MIILHQDLFSNTSYYWFADSQTSQQEETVEVDSSNASLLDMTKTPNLF